MCKITLVMARDSLREVPLGHASHDTLYFLQGGHNGIQCVVHALNNRAEITFMLVSIGPGFQNTVYRRSGQHIGIGHHAIHGLNGAIEVVLEGVEITLIGV